MTDVPFRGVVLDWRGTLVRTLTDDEWLAAALDRLGRPVPRPEVDRLVGVLNGLREALDAPGTDTCAERQRDTYARAFRGAGMDDDLAAALYAVESDLAHNPYAEDAAPTLEALHRGGLRVAVLSDIHVNIRPSLAGAGLAHFVDVVRLSFETGLQKPAPPGVPRHAGRVGHRASGDPDGR